MYVNEFGDQKNANLLSRMSVPSRKKKNLLHLYCKKKFQTTPSRSTSNHPGNFSISINYHVPANHSEEARASRGQFLYCCPFYHPSEIASESERFPTAERCVPAISISRRLAAMKGAVE